jgi:hypothetical protein
VAIRMPYQRTVRGPRWKAIAPGEANTKITIPRPYRAPDGLGVGAPPPNLQLTPAPLFRYTERRK